MVSSMALDFLTKVLATQKGGFSNEQEKLTSAHPSPTVGKGLKSEFCTKTFQVYACLYTD